MSTERDVLPKLFKPVHYNLDIHSINVKENTFEGDVEIELDVLESSDSIVLHANDIEFKKVEVKYLITKTESIVPVKELVKDSKKQTITIELAEVLKAGPAVKVYLTINYIATIKSNMSGFYRSDYKDVHGKEQVLLSTQFEATDARSAFPCFDEPNLKATFQVTVTAAEDFTILSNTPISSSKVLDDGKKKGAIEASGLKKVVFQKTLQMSTYLLAWAIGKLEYIEGFTDKDYNGSKLPIRVYTAEGESQKGKFALDVASKVIDFFSEIFEIDYVLPKLDLVSVPAYSHNAMENWGLVTFRPTALLYDESTSDPDYQTKVAYVVAHELAHQWFGNLVTMNWWDELWLNEGFATWVGYYAIEHIYPNWKIFDQFASDSLQTALELDSLRSSHPVEVPIQSSADIDQVFDHISYLKGGSVINQMSESIGQKTFLKGVSNYLKKHSFSNATTNDLLSSISEVSNVDMVSIGDSWIRKIGFPYIKVELVSGTNDVKLTQNRFISNGDLSQDENQTLWSIPLRISTGLNADDLNTEYIYLSERSLVIKDLAAKPFKINKNCSGVFRTIYDEQILKQILENNDKLLSSTDKVGLIADIIVGATAGLVKTSACLETISLFKGETEFVVWNQIIKSFKLILSAFYKQDQHTLNKLKDFMIEFVLPTVLSLGFKKLKDEDYLTAKTRNLLLSFSVDLKIPNIVETLKEIYKSGEIDPSLRKIVYSSMLSDSNSTKKEFYEIYDIISTSKALDEREIVLSALGTVNNDELIEQALSLILTVPIMDVQFIGISLAKNTTTREKFWAFFKENYDAIYKRLNVNPVVFDRFVKFTLCYFSDEYFYNDIKEFFKDKDIYGFERSLDQVLDSIKTNSAWVKRDAEDVANWVK